MTYQGNYTEDFADLNFKFTTRDAGGTPTTLSGTPVVSVYKSNDTTQSTAGITLSVDFDSVTGLNNVKIDLSADAFYAITEDYDVVITTGTVDGVSVVGETVGSFSIQNRFIISVSDILTTQMTQSYAADGVAPTLAQALFLVQQSVGDFSISGTTLTVKQLDGSTTAATYTLDDASNPTSRTRAT